MWTQTADGREFITQISRQLVTEVAPEELDLFDELMAEYFDDPAPPVPADSPDDDPLGFGLSEILVVVTPAAGAVVSTVLSYILAEVIKTTQEESARAITNKLKSLFNSKEKAERLTPDQLKQVHQVALKQARLFGLDPIQAKQMASSLVGSLAVAA